MALRGMRPLSYILELMMALSMDTGRPVYVRRDGTGWATVNYFPTNGSVPTHIKMREDTLGPLDLFVEPPKRVG